ncbi:MAG: lysylphosphatidylglycerol synthase domain-containing protein [Knoellia sp.]
MAPTRPTLLRREGEAALAVALAVSLLAFGLPRVAGVSWRQIGDVLSSVTALGTALLTAVWLAGLWLHTIALSAALPGLNHRRAFFLNITGSAVSNVLPLGGAAGSAINLLSARRWGFSTADFLRWALVTNIWDVLSRLVVPGIALTWLALDGSPSRAMREAGLGASGLLVGLMVFTIAALRTESWARRAGGLADRVVRRVDRLRPRGSSYASMAVTAQHSVAQLIAGAWVRLTIGKAAYAALQAVLLWLCLRLLGAQPPLAIVFATFAAERVLSLAVISPAATGIVELGMAGFLVASGVDHATAAGSVLLYRMFVVGMEVPVGGVLLAWWFGRRLVLRTRRLPRGVAHAVADTNRRRPRQPSARS